MSVMRLGYVHIRVTDLEEAPRSLFEHAGHVGRARGARQAAP